MELLEGEDLEKVLARRGALPPQEAVSHALQACEGLAEAHALGIIHRDIKPQNLFLAGPPGAPGRLKILDFGIAKVTAASAEAEALTTTSQSIGSPMYMAPEQMRDARLVDERADLWSLGVVLYRMLAGKPPFEAPTVHALCAAILSGTPAPLPPGAALPAALCEAVMRCLEHAPARRFRSVGALAACLAPHGGPDAEARLARILQIEAARTTPLAPLDDLAALPTQEPLDDPAALPTLGPLDDPAALPTLGPLDKPPPVSGAPRLAAEGSASVTPRRRAAMSLPVLVLVAVSAPLFVLFSRHNPPAPAAPEAVASLAPATPVSPATPVASALPEPRADTSAVGSVHTPSPTVLSAKIAMKRRRDPVSPQPSLGAPPPSLPEAPQDAPLDRTTDTRR
jgi:serine/threonine-protein kinase